MPMQWGSHANLHVVSWKEMSFPIKTCVVCEEEFELKPDKPGFANRCPKCSAPEEDAPAGKERMDSDTLKSSREANAARRQAIKDLLYSRK
jgi:hypothetical protein